MGTRVTAACQHFLDDTDIDVIDRPVHRPRSNQAPLGHHVWVHPPSPPCPNTDRPGAAWSPLIQIPVELPAHPSLSHICDEKSQFGRTCGFIFHSFWWAFVLFKWHCVISEDYQHLCGLSVLIHVLSTLRIQYNLCTVSKDWKQK